MFIDKKIINSNVSPDRNSYYYKKTYLFVKLIGTDKGEHKNMGLTVVSVTFSMYAGLTMQQDR